MTETHIQVVTSPRAITKDGSSKVSGQVRRVDTAVKRQQRKDYWPSNMVQLRSVKLGRQAGLAVFK